MKPYNIDINPFGERAIIITWPNKVDELILRDIIQYSDHLKKVALTGNEWEFIPSYNSLTLVSNFKPIDYTSLKDILVKAYSEKKDTPAVKNHLWKLPVCYDLVFGIDLEEVAEFLEMGIEETIQVHTQTAYIVYGIGFLPGFMYLGGLPEILEIPRKSAPRMKVMKGSVGLAGKQTGIYPQESPGGWNIIGNCPIPIFNVEKEDPCFVKVGDRIQFYPVTVDEHRLHKIEAEVGIYNIEKTVWNADS